MSLKYYPKTFVNPLLAIAFKEGIDFVGDPDFKATGPKKEGEKWIVTVEHNDDDDEEEDTSHSTVNKSPTTTLREFEDRFKRMTPIMPRVAPKEIIHQPVKIEAETDIDMTPCGECLPCSQGQDCLKVINAACSAWSGRER